MTDVGRGQTTPSIEQRVYLRFQRKMNGNATELRKGLSCYSIFGDADAVVHFPNPVIRSMSRNSSHLPTH